MGVTHSYRWVRTTEVPNNNTGTYAVPYHSTGLDMGANNTYRYVNTTNAYNQGYSNGNTDGYNTGYNAAKFISAVNVKLLNYGIPGNNASFTWYGYPGVYYFYGHVKVGGEKDYSVSSVTNGTLIAKNTIRQDTESFYTDMGVIRANAEGNVTAHLANGNTGGNGFVTLYEIIIG